MFLFYYLLQLVVLQEIHPFTLNSKVCFPLVLEVTIIQPICCVFQIKKAQDRVQKAKEEVQKNNEKYGLALKELNSYNPKYMEDMSTVFEKCQEMEAQRLQFFKDVLFNVHKYLNVSQDPV